VKSLKLFKIKLKVTCRANNLRKESEAINFRDNNFSLVNNKVEKIGCLKLLKLRGLKGKVMNLLRERGPCPTEEWDR
jgi:hypothetical protein